MRFILTTTAALLSAALVEPVMATPITILNPSFEQPGVEIYANNANWVNTSWTASPATAFIGIYPAATYNLYFDPLPDGNKVLAIYTSTGAVSQTTSHAFALNEEYTLSVWGGRRKNASEPFGVDSQLRLYAGATLLTSIQLAVPDLGRWLPNTLTFGPSSPNYGAVAGALGQNLRVEMFVIPGGNNWETDFDKVELSFELVPEPASLALFTLGGVAALRRRRA